MRMGRRRLTLPAAVVAGALVAGLAAWAGGPRLAHAATRRPAAAALVMVQGSVVALVAGGAEIETTPIRPVCQPDRACPMYILAPQRIDVRIGTHTPLYSAIGSPVPRSALAVGVSLAAAGTFAPPPALPAAAARAFTAQAVDVTQDPVSVGSCEDATRVCPR